jgi:hypothetical protein
MDFAEHMTVDGLVNSTHTFAGEPYRKSLPSQPASIPGLPARTAIARPGKSGNAAMSAPC